MGKSVRNLVLISFMGSLSFLLMKISVPILPAAPFLKLDISDSVSFLAAIMMGPVAGVLVELLKNTIHYILDNSMTGVPIDQASNFTAGILFLLPAYYIYTKLNSKKGMLVGFSAGIVAMTVGMSVLNYFLFVPAYTWFLNAPAWESAALLQFILSAVVPFNLIKGAVVAGVSYILVTRLHTVIERNRASVPSSVEKSVKA
ncbi:ECF transporter S component [Mangrovibacillus cuniculi]|uniref:Riboflavin transporter n=1 Tax=Mangrovibacillus cuniculi TaxID=2593652 RepID=A0A7S8HFE3_9BACI|nr:ECF transporter S component [Mangrovibacillus cuniculi]QPC46733.1 ECF transporter S component [Mangrovibacillus cuniculi]